MNTPEDILLKKLEFARDRDMVSCPIYLEWIRELLKSDWERQLLSYTARNQPIPHVYFAMVRYLRTLDGLPESLNLKDLRSFSFDNEERIRKLLPDARNQTNEVARSAYFHLALRWLSSHGVSEIDLWELGSSAGFLLFPDYYSYSFEKEPGKSVLDIQIDSTDDYPQELENFEYSIGQRKGFEYSPIHYQNPKERAWLQALIWPSHDSRKTRLSKLEKLPFDQIDWIAGDYRKTLPDAIYRRDESKPLVILDSFSFYQLTQECQTELKNLMLEHSNKSTLAFLQLGWDGTVSQLQCHLMKDGDNSSFVLAQGDPHAHHVKWLLDI